MKSVWLAALAGTTISAGMIAAAPAVAQVAEQDPVKQGVDAWERGDYKTAVEKWRGPAVAGNADAQFNLGQAYKLGRGVPSDLAQAEEWYRKAAMQGHPQAEDNYGLALFQNGKRTQAVTWLEKSSNRGEPRAQFVLGTMYFNGDSVERDWVRAYALIVRSSQSGLPQASAALAQMDKYVSLQERQQGLALARQYEDMANRPRPTVDYAANTPRPTTTQPPRTTPPVTQPPRPRPTPTPTTVAATTKPPVAAPMRDGGWRLQLGAFGDPSNARKLGAQMGGRFPGRQVSYVKQGSLTKVLVGPFASRAEAAGACRGVSPCVPVSN